MHFRSIRTALTLVISIAILILQALLIGYVTKSNYETITGMQRKEMDNLLRPLSREVEAFASEQTSRIKTLAGNQAVRAFLSSGRDEARVEDLLSFISLSSDEINTVYLLDSSGKQVKVAAAGAFGKPADISGREYVQAVLAGRNGSSSVPTKSVATGKMIISFTTPVYDDRGKLVGGVGISCLVDQMISRTIDATKVGNSGYPFILSSKGVMVAHPDRGKVLKDFSDRDFVRACLTRPDGGSRSYAWEGVNKIESWMPIPKLGWILVLTVSEDEFTAHAVRQRNYLIAAGAVAALILAAICLFCLERMAVKPLQALERYASAVAGGDFDASLRLTQQNEIGKLAAAFRTMVTALKDKITEATAKERQAQDSAALAQEATAKAEQALLQANSARAQGMLDATEVLHGVVETISEAVRELSDQVAASSDDARRQTDRMGETATAMEQMNTAVADVAQNATQTAATADTAKQKAIEGARRVTEVVAGIGEVQEQALGLKGDMGNLGRQAEGIGQVMAVISDIADQTNLLALNAAIEAARAGDAGRGFAVVADEVRKLAEKTMNATKEVGEAIEDIQHGARKNVDNVNRAVGAIDAATSRAGQSGEALKEIVDLVDLTTDQVRTIATASEEQSSASGEINRSVSEVSALSEKTASGMDYCATVVSKVAEQVQVIRDLIGQMRGESRHEDQALPDAGGQEPRLRLVSAASRRRPPALM